MARSVRIGVVGVGNCASALIQGMAYYRDHAAVGAVPGLMHEDLGGYRISDITLATAFDVSGAKVGQDLAEAIHSHPNNADRVAPIAATGVVVQRGPTLDGLGEYLRASVEESTAAVVDVAAVLRQTRTEILVCYLPVGAQQATEWYATEALKAGCAFINCIPVFIASNPTWAERFAARGLPIIGDDIKSQLGATILHRVLARLMQDRGLRLDRTSQLNVGGNADFLNMLERSRLVSKKISKTQAVTSQLTERMREQDIHIGPSDFIPWLEDRKWAHLRLEATGFAGLPINLEVKLEVHDSPNSAGVVIDAIRCAKLALDRGIGGPLIGPCSYFMKSPPRQFTDAEARVLTQGFIDGQA